VSRDLPAAQQRVSGSSEDLPVWVPRTWRSGFTHRMLFAVSRRVDDWGVRDRSAAVAKHPGNLGPNSQTILRQS